MSSKQKNQGEGNREADKDYRSSTRDFVKSGKVSDSAEKARDAVEGAEREDLKQAEREGRKPARR
ncbi:MAG: hypothetical protein WD767_03115 [Alphaproteobacteria bacterium]